jgi:hypothetical protein
VRAVGRSGLAWRLAVTVGLVYSLHFAPNVVRETYLAVSIAERFSIRVDPFLGLHPDLFEVPGRGAYINNNPGASMIAAIPYAAVLPALELLYRLKPSLVAPKPPAAYDDPRPNRTRFMNEMRARGLDVRLALAAAAIHLGLNIPLGVAAALMLFGFLCARLGDERRAAWLALLFAFGTPIFFRSAFLNQNLLLAYCTLAAYFCLTWEPPSRRDDWHPSVRRIFAAGLALGVGLLCDYSALPLVAVFGVWVLVVRARDGGWLEAGRAAAWFAAGTVGPVAVLLGYQQAAFGNPWLPAQSYMPSTLLSIYGWRGVQLPSPDLLWRNLVDPGYGLFAFCPMLVAALWAPRYRSGPGGLKPREAWLVFGASAALYVFSSSIAYAALQWNTGVRYLVPAAPLLFIAVVPVLLNAPRWIVWSLVVPTVTISWAVAMARENVVLSLLRVFTLGFELPWHTVLQKTAEAYLPALARGGSPLALFVLVGVVLWLVWTPERHEASSRDTER